MADEVKKTPVKIDNEAWEEAKRQFIDDNIRNSPIAANTDAWNHFHAVFDNFRGFLQKQL